MNKFDLKTLLQYAQKPAVDAQSTAPFWDDPHISEGLLAAHLNPSFDAASRKPETIDASVRWISEELNLPAEAQVLDLGCGPGLYASRLAKLGYQVIGIDYSRRSIAYATEQAEQENLPITYKYQDYLTLDYENQCDLITLIYCDLGPLNDEDRDTLLQKVYQALKPGGIFLFDIFTEEMFKEQKESQTWFMEESGFWRPIPYLCLDSHYVYPEHDIHMDHHIILDETGKLEVYLTRDHYYSKETITPVLEACGFRELEYFADVAGKEWEDQSKMICIVARK